MWRPFHLLLLHVQAFPYLFRHDDGWERERAHCARVTWREMAAWKYLQPRHFHGNALSTCDDIMAQKMASDQLQSSGQILLLLLDLCTALMHWWHRHGQTKKAAKLCGAAWTHDFLDCSLILQGSFIWDDFQSFNLICILPGTQKIGQTCS